MEVFDLPRYIMNEFAYLILGEKRIGYGMSRDVYHCQINEDWVIKIETQAGGYFQNALEWRTWSQLQDTPAAKWLAPCYHISDSGNILIQQRTIPLRKEEAPKTLPEWLSDTKLTNYGLYKGRVVCHDYGTNLLLNHGSFSKKMRKDIHWS